jgi:hypothetical protein
MPDCVALFWHRTGSGIVNFFQSGIGLTGCWTVLHSGIKFLQCIFSSVVDPGSRIQDSAFFSVLLSRSRKEQHNFGGARAALNVMFNMGYFQKRTITNNFIAFSMHIGTGTYYNFRYTESEEKRMSSVNFYSLCRSG